MELCLTYPFHNEPEINNDELLMNKEIKLLYILTYKNKNLNFRTALSHCISIKLMKK